MTYGSVDIQQWVQKRRAQMVRANRIRESRKAKLRTGVTVDGVYNSKPSTSDSSPPTCAPTQCTITTVGERVQYRSEFQQLRQRERRSAPTGSRESAVDTSVSLLSEFSQRLDLTENRIRTLTDENIDLRRVIAEQDVLIKRLEERVTRFDGGGRSARHTPMMSRDYSDKAFPDMTEPYTSNSSQRTHSRNKDSVMSRSDTLKADRESATDSLSRTKETYESLRSQVETERKRENPSSQSHPRAASARSIDAVPNYSQRLEKDRSMSANFPNRSQSTAKLPPHASGNPYAAASLLEGAFPDAKETSVVRIACCLCNRKFAKDRIDKHMNACRKSRQKRQKFNMKSSRLAAFEGQDRTIVRQAMRKPLTSRRKPPSLWREKSRQLRDAAASSREYELEERKRHQSRSYSSRSYRQAHSHRSHH